MTGLLVSVRNADEALAALEGGADLIDVKEPGRGALGRADDATIAAVVQAVAGRRPVSAAMGELHGDRLPCTVTGLAYYKWGCAGYPSPADQGLWSRISWHAEGTVLDPNVLPHVAVAAYADHHLAQAPPPEVVCQMACRGPCGAFLLDTFRKDGSTLLDWMSPHQIASLCKLCRHAGVRVALAGSLGSKEIEQLSWIKPGWFAVRGAACRQGRREATIDVGRVRELAALVHAANQHTIEHTI